MFTTDNKKTSRSLLFVLIAVLIIALPSAASDLVGMYAAFAVTSAFLAWRTYELKKITVVKNLSALVMFIFYAVLCGLWCKNPEGQLKSIILMLFILEISVLSADYFSNLGKNSDRKLMYLTVVSAFLCSVVNVVVWLTHMVPLGEYAAFSSGMGQSDALGAFMATGVLSCLFLARQAEKKLRAFLYIMLVPMIFALIMSRSVCAFILMISLFISAKNEKGNKRATLISIILATVCAIIFISGNHTAISDSFITGIKRPLGLGGGGYLLRQEEFITSYYPKVKFLPLMSVVAADFGVIGLATLGFFVFRLFVQIAKNPGPKNVSALCVLIFALFMPFKNGYAALMLIMGFITYVSADSFEVINLKKKNTAYITNTLCVIAAASVFLSCHALIRKSADEKYKEGNLALACESYKNAAAMNPFDGESCRKVLICLRKTEAEDIMSEENQAFMKKSYRRLRGSVDSLVENARYLGACGDYVSAADNWRVVLMKAPHNHEYRISFVKLLYKAVKECEKGSSESKKIYDEITSISENTQNLDARKVINDIRDKALAYTKSELKALPQEEITQ